MSARGVAAPDDDEIRSLLAVRPVIALVGASSKEWRPSFIVMRELVGEGYDVVPVHPRGGELLGRKVYPDLQSIPRPVDLVDVFRRADQTPAVARDAVAIGARTLWLQLGIVNDEAARIAGAAGLVVVMDRCTLIEHHRLVGIRFPGPGDPVGLCRDCRHTQRVETPRSVFWRCGRSDGDPTYPRYPALPVLGCRGFQLAAGK